MALLSKVLALVWLSTIACFAQSIVPGPIIVIGGSSSTLNTGLTAYWKLDEASGTRVDSGANGQDLTDNNTVTSNTGIINNAAEFIAANLERLSHVDSTTLSLGDIDCTMAFWVYLSSTNTAMGIGNQYAAAGSRSWRLLYFSSSAKFRIGVSNDGTTVTNHDSTFVNPVASTWYLVIWWHDSVNDLIGIDVSGTSNTSSYSSGIFDSTADFNVGRQDSGGTYWNGRIDEVGFWKRVLTAGERAELYNSGAGKTCCPF